MVSMTIAQAGHLFKLIFKPESRLKAFQNINPKGTGKIPTIERRQAVINLTNERRNRDLVGCGNFL